MHGHTYNKSGYNAASRGSGISTFRTKAPLISRVNFQDVLTLKEKAVRDIETSRSGYPVMQCHIPAEWNHLEEILTALSKGLLNSYSLTYSKLGNVIGRMWDSQGFVKVMVLRYDWPCGLVHNAPTLRWSLPTVFQGTVFRNVGTHLQNQTASHPQII